MRGRNRRRHRPKAKKEDDNPKKHRESIDQDAEDTWKMKRTPDKLISPVRIVRDVGRFANGTCAPAPEEEALCDDVGCVETADAEGDDIVEGGGGADVNEADQAGNQGCYHDGQERDCSFGLDLSGFVSRKFGATWREDQRTLLTVCHPGKPRSRANAQIRRDAVAMKAMFAATPITITMAIRTEDPAFEPVAS